MKEIDLSSDIQGKSKEESRKYLKHFYDMAFESSTYRPINSYSTWLHTLRQMKKQSYAFEKGIEIGCGLGLGVSLANELGYDVWGMDLADISRQWKSHGISDKCIIASAVNIPFQDNTFDYVLIPDVMEHIPEDDIVQVLKEIRRIGSKEYLFFIHIDKEKEPIRAMTDKGNFKIYTHICIKKSEWWENKLREAGYYIIDFETKKPHIMAYCLKEKPNEMVH